MSSEEFTAGNQRQIGVGLGIMFAVAITIANVTAAKLAWFDLPVIGGVAVPAGFIAIGVAFLVSDLMAELVGKDYARSVVNATVVALLAAWGLIYAAIALPAAPFYEGHAAYVSVLGSGANIVAASIVTTLVSQHVDVSVFHAIRGRTGEARKWARNLGSTTVSQFVDTVLFIALGFIVFPMLFGGSPQPLAVAAQLVAGQYAVKLVVAAADTPLFYAATALTSRKRRVHA